MDQLIRDLYSSANQGSKDRVQEIQCQIQQLQRQPSAWQLALDFLHNGDANVRFYGALTLIVKINADWDTDGISTNDAMKASIHQALISDYVRLALSGDAAFVIQKLCSAIAMLYQRLAGTWQSPVLQVLVSLLKEKYVEPNQLPSLTDALASANSTSIKHLFAAVRFATTIAEDLIDRSTVTHSEILSLLSNSCDDAFRLFDFALDLAHSKLNTNDLDGQRLDMAQTAIQGMLPWQVLMNTVASRSSSNETETTLQIVADAMRKVFKFYQTEGLRSYVLQALIWVQQNTPRFMIMVDPSFPQSLMRSSAARQTVQNLLEGNYDHEETLFVDLLDAIMSQVNSTSSGYLQDEALTDVLQVLQALLRCPGVAAIEDTVCQVILEIINQLVSGRAEWDADAEDRDDQFFISYTREACEACFAKALMPAEEMSSATQTWDADDRSRFSSFRFDVQDFLLAAFPVLGPALPEAITSNLQRPHTQANWPAYEASVFCLRAFADAMSEDPAAFTPYIEAVLSSQYFYLVLTSRDVPDQARKTSISFLSDTTAFIKQHPKLMQILDFLFASLHMPTAATSASQAIYALCYDQRASLTGALPGFMASLSTVDDIDASDRQRIFAAVSAVIQALQGEEQKAEPLLQIIHTLSSALNVINNTDMSAEDLNAQLADVLRSMAAVGRGLRIPNDVPSELDSPVSTDTAFWTTGAGSSVQQQVLALYEKVMSKVVSGTRDPGITEAASDFLRSGLTEEHPSPFKFPVAVSTNLVTALITADSANIDAVLGCASCLLLSAQRVEMAAHLPRLLAPILDVLLQLVAEHGRTGEVKDGSFAAASLDFFSRLLPKWVDALLCLNDGATALAIVIDTALIVMAEPDTLPRRSAASFFSALIDASKAQKGLSAGGRASIDTIIREQSPRLVALVLRLVAGGCARSELEALSDVVAKLVQHQPMLFKAICREAMQEQSRVLPEQALQATTLEQRNRFVAQVELLRGQRKTLEKVKEFWVLANNPYAQGVNGYAGSANGTNPYAAGGGGAPSDPYLQQQNRGAGDQPPRRGGVYGGLMGLPANPAPPRMSEPDYDPFIAASRVSNSRGRDQRPNPQEPGRFEQASAEELRPQARDQNPYGGRDAAPPTSAADAYNTAPMASTNRYNGYSRQRPQKSMDDIMKHIESHWKMMEGDECVPIKTALQLMDQSSLGLADKEQDFSSTHVDLQRCLKAVVNEHYADFNSAVGTYHKIQNAIRESQTRVRMLKSGLMSIRGGMLTTRPELRGLAETSGQLDNMFGVLATIDELKGVPARLEERISEKRFLSAVDLLIDSLRSLRRGELENIAALSDMRSYFANQESSLVDILCEELHDHLYLKSPYCVDRWKRKSGKVESGGQPMPSANDSSNAWDRPVYHYLASLNTAEVMVEDATKNPEADSFYYIHMILESLNKLGFLEEAIQRVENRMPIELYRLVDKTNNEVDARYPSHVRGQLRKEKRSAIPTRNEDGRSQVLDDFLRTLYAKFEAIAEGHRVLHEVVAGIAAREGISKPDRLIGGFKELWKLYQMEIRSILHDYLATDGDGVQRAATSAASTDIFARQQRDKNKKMFKLSEMDKKALGIKAEADELDEILKASVPGLVNKSRGKGLKHTLDRNGTDNTSAGHKLLIEPGVFNITALLPPSLAFLQHLKDVVPQTAQIPMSTLTSFLDDFLINIFHPQLEESVTELCSQCMVDIEAFSEAAMWSKHSPRPIFKGTIAFMSLIRSFSHLLSSIPQDQMFTQLIINQLVRYYDKCFGFYKAVASRVAASGTNTLTLKAAAQFAEQGKIRDAALELLQAESSSPHPSELVDKEVSEMLSATKASPISSFDVISDPKSIRQLCLLYNSMKWLASALAQLRHVDAAAGSTTSHSRNTSKSENARRWTLIKPIKPPGLSATGSANFLPLTSETVIPFDHTLTSFGSLATTSLLTLHFDIRCLAIYSLSRVLRGPDFGNNGTSPPSRIDSSAFPPLGSGAYPFVLPSPPSSASPLILQLNNDLIAFDASIASSLGLNERHFIVYGLSKLVDNYMVIGADNILVMNANGAEKLRVDAIVVQQNLRGIAAGASERRGGLNAPTENGLGIVQDSDTAERDEGKLTRTYQYYTLFLDGPDQVINFIKEKKAKNDPIGYTYDELRTLIELCWSEKLRGEDREESVRARKRSGEVLLGLGELIWDS
ncbi:hypothetical protein DV737_g303, partial [Chaetothyriales sp. CBS 132003]